MNDYEKLSHTTWECKYHVVFIPKYRRKTLFGKLRAELGPRLRLRRRRRANSRVFLGPLASTTGCANS
jgi:putative transposase